MAAISKYPRYWPFGAGWIYPEWMHEQLFCVCSPEVANLQDFGIVNVFIIFGSTQKVSILGDIM